MRANDLRTPVEDAPSWKTAQASSIRCEALIGYDGLVAIQMHDPDGVGPYAPPSTALPCPNAAIWEVILPPDVLICNTHDLRGCLDCDCGTRKLWLCGRCLASFDADDLDLMSFRRL